MQGDSYIAGLERVHGKLNNIEDLLSAIESGIEKWSANEVVGMKVALAYYDHGLDLRNPSHEQAKQAFNKRDRMNIEDVRMVRDYALLYAFDLCVKKQLPIVIHTGFLAWGNANLKGTNPVLLQPLISSPRYHSATFVLLHGGYPYTGETAFLAARYPNVVIDFTWLPWLSPTRFYNALMEWLENVPFSKFVWGSDSSIMPESIVGIDRISRILIAQTLQQAIRNGLLNYEVALRFIKLSYQTNACRIFNLTTNETVNI